MSGREIDNVLFLGNTKIFEQKKLHSVFTFTKAYLYVTVGQIRFFKPYLTIFYFCVHLLLREVLCLYQAKECFNLLRQSFVKDKWVFSRFVDDFTCPSFTLSVFWVPKTRGIWVRGYPKHRDTQITMTPPLGGSKEFFDRAKNGSQCTREQITREKIAQYLAR